MKYSVIIPAFCCEKTLVGTVNSVLLAGFRDYEILLIDDGSSDGTLMLCDALAKEYECIRYIHQENAGVSAARNRGIREAEGEYVFFVDADDLFLPVDEEVLHILDTRDVDMLIFGMVVCTSHRDKTIKEEKLCVKKQQIYELGALIPDFSELFYLNCFTPVWNKFFRRSCLINNDTYFDEKLNNYEDLDFSLRVMSRCRKIAVVQQAYYRYRVDYDHDKTVDRIAKIQDIMGNTDLIAEAFVEFERSALAAGATDTRQIWECLRNIYFELFRVKMQTTKYSNIGDYCRDFQNDKYVSLCLEKAGLESKSQNRWYRWIETENAPAIWLYVRYGRLRHFAARNIKRITGWRL